MTAGFGLKVSPLKPYVVYIRNTAQRPLAISAFDEDWDPIGPRIRADLLAQELIEEADGALMLTAKGEAL